MTIKEAIAEIRSEKCPDVDRAFQMFCALSDLGDCVTEKLAAGFHLGYFFRGLMDESKPKPSNPAPPESV